jgi:hypothetical protein
MPSDDDDAYNRGHAAGGIAERLDSHDRHFASINGSLAEVARQMHQLVLAVQRLGDQAESNAKTVVTTAAALEKAESARRARAERSWSPIARLATVLGTLAAVAGAFAAVAWYLSQR